MSELSNREKEVITEFLNFLLDEGYCDSDVYSEGKTAIDQFCEINRKNNK